MLGFIRPKSILAITATAGPRVIQDICRALDISNATTTTVTTRIPDDAPTSMGKEALTGGDCGVRIMNTDRDNIDVSCFFLSSQAERLSTVSFEHTDGDKNDLSTPFVNIRISL